MAWNSSLKEGSAKQCWSFLLTSTASYQSDGLLRLLKTNSFLILTKMSHNHNHTVSSQLKHLSKGFIVSFLENSFSPAHTHLAHLSVEVGYPSSWVKKYKRGPWISSAERPVSHAHPLCMWHLWSAAHNILISGIVRKCTQEQIVILRKCVLETPGIKKKRLRQLFYTRWIVLNDPGEGESRWEQPVDHLKEKWERIEWVSEPARHVGNHSWRRGPGVFVKPHLLPIKQWRGDIH